MNIFKTIATGISIIGFLLFSWEYTAIRRELTYSPSVTLNKGVEFFRFICEELGNMAARLSSFLTIFDFSDMLKALNRLWTPCWQMITSGAYFFKGYVSEMNLYEHPYLVTLGSIILVFLVFYSLRFFNILKIPTPDFSAPEFYSKQQQYNSSSLSSSSSSNDTVEDCSRTVRLRRNY